MMDNNDKNGTTNTAFGQDDDDFSEIKFDKDDEGTRGGGRGVNKGGTFKAGQPHDRLKWILIVILVAVIAVCVICLAVRLVKLHRAKSVYDDLQSAVTLTVDTEPEPSEEPEETETEETHVHGTYDGVPEVDFDALWETNEDIVAWITIPDTQVDYPVLRSADATDPYDDYYLEHTVEHVSGLPGSIYMEPCNSGDFTDLNTVIYGHNMKNGSMFGSLHNFDDDVFFDEHPYVYVVTPDMTLVYEIYAAIDYDDRHIMASYNNFATTASLESFLESLKSNRNIADKFRDGMEVSADDDTFLTLSTCVKGQDDMRLIIVSALVDWYDNDEVGSGVAE